MNENFCTNRKARHEFGIVETLEAGIVLFGTEVKSVRNRKVSLEDAFATVKDGEVWLHNCHIEEYSFRSVSSHEPKRCRKLLLNKQEIRNFATKAEQKGFTLIPLRVYSANGKIKVELAVAQGRKLHDKRNAIRDRDLRRDLKEG